MAEISCKEFEIYLQKQGHSGGPFSPVYLIYGEEVLYRAIHDALVSAILPPEARELNHEGIEGDPENVPALLDRMNTYSLLSGAKVVSFQNAKLFYSRQGKETLLEKAGSAWDAGDKRKAAGYVLSAMGALGLTLEDMGERGGGIAQLMTDPQEAGWLEEVFRFCREKQMTTPSGKEGADRLQQAVERGFPEGNYLIITTDLVDRRRSLFTCLKEAGTVVDCSVPKGNRQVDRRAQEELLRERVARILTPRGKHLEPRAFAALMELTGFDLRTFSGNLEKLALFSGDRQTITARDVASVLDRTREDPIYEFTGAVCDRDLDRAFFQLKALLSQNIHPLQVMAALVNQFRKVMLAKAFTLSDHGRAWHGTMDYTVFRSRVLPAIKAYDAELSETNERMAEMTSASAEGGTAPGKKAKKKKSRTAELMVAQNPNNAYPVYLMLKKAALFSMEELMRIYGELSDVDMLLKSTPQDPRILLETLLLHICAP
jgi:DNA polymerase III subunit delta